jgi:putative FmdB family regulatory protein
MSVAVAGAGLCLHGRGARASTLRVAPNLGLEYWHTNSLSSFSQEDVMPVYDYVCLDCHKTFEEVLTLKDHDNETVKCPKCGSKNVEQEATAFFAVTARKS